MRVADALAAPGLDPGEARILLADAAGFPLASLLAHPERELPGEAAARFEANAGRRRAGEPVAYILGRREFYGLDFAVTPAVLIPRHETELLVERALACRPATVLDLGTGSGAVAIAVKRHLPGVRVVAVEASAAALAVAQRNAVKLDAAVDLRHGQWFGPVDGERFDVVVSNPPYVAEGDRHLAEGDVRFEPRGALVAGVDGLDDIRAIVRAAPAYLQPGGSLLLEHGIGQDAEVGRLMREAGFAAVETWPDLAGIARVTGGKV